MELKQQSQKMETLIRDDWYDSGQVYRDIDAAVIVSLLTKNASKEDEALKQEYITRLAKFANGEKSLLKILEKADEQYQNKTNAIDDIYLKQTTLEESAMALEHKNMLYANIAFLLQIIGLVLVIVTRDLPDTN